MGGGTSASLEDERSVFGLGALVTTSCGCPRTLEGVNRGEAEEDCLDEDDTAGEDVREGVLLLLASFMSLSASSCLTEFASALSSMSTSIDMP